MFRAVAIVAPFLLGSMGIVAHAAYQELTASYEYCGAYGMFDDELGWKLRENATSCLSFRNRLTGQVFFDTRIYTNRLGFRDSRAANDVAPGGIVAIGDSSTFGYGVEYEQSYPSFLARLSGRPVVNAGVPAYGAGSVLLLLRRNVERLRPRAVVYLTKGLWTRSVCRRERATQTLIPCFVSDAEGHIRLVAPAQGALARAVQDHRYPGGFLTAGHDMPLRRKLARRLMFQWKRIAGREDTEEPIASAVEGAQARAIVHYELEQHLDLARRFGFVLLLVDPLGAYHDAVARLGRSADERLVYLGEAAWRDMVQAKLDRLPVDRVLIPYDLHYTADANRIVAEAIHSMLGERLSESSF